MILDKVSPVSFHVYLVTRKKNFCIVSCINLWHSPVGAVHTVMVAVEDQEGFDSIIPGVYYWVSEVSPHTTDVNRDSGGKSESAVALSM